MPKRGKKKSRIPEAKVKALLERDRILTDCIQKIQSACSAISETERVLKLPRTAYDDTLRNIEEHYQEIGDAIQSQGIKLCGEIDRWVEYCNAPINPHAKQSLREKEIASAYNAAVNLLDLSTNYEIFGKQAKEAEEYFGQLISILQA